MSTDLSAVHRAHIDCLNGRAWDELGAFVRDDVVHNGRSLGLSGYRGTLEGDVRPIPDLRFTVASWSATPPPWRPARSSTARRRGTSSASPPAATRRTAISWAKPTPCGPPVARRTRGPRPPRGKADGRTLPFGGLVQDDDGVRSNLIGTPPQVAERIVAPKRAGADPILLGFLHVRGEVEYVGRHAIPPVRELEAASPLAVAAE